MRQVRTMALVLVGCTVILVGMGVCAPTALSDITVYRARCRSHLTRIRGPFRCRAWTRRRRVRRQTPLSVSGLDYMAAR